MTLKIYTWSQKPLHATCPLIVGDVTIVIHHTTIHGKNGL